MKEQDIRPDNLFKHYLELSGQDAESMLSRRGEFLDISCPGCGSFNKKKAFDKKGFIFNGCCECNSLYCSPRPSPKQLGDFCVRSKSARFWARDFFPAVIDARRQKLFRPKAEAIYKMFTEMSFEPQVICDVGAGYGVLLQELCCYWKSAELRAVEPHKELAKACREKEFETLEATAQNSAAWAKTVDLLLCFEVIEHVFNVTEFVRSLFELIRPGGYCLVSSLCSEGFDLQMLGPESNSIFPPHHINFLSIDGARRLFKHVGFENIMLSTPGELDVDIVKNILAQKPYLDIPGWVRLLLKQGEAACSDFQSFLKRHCLSSHLWVIARKPC